MFLPVPLMDRKLNMNPTLQSLMHESVN